MSDYFVFDSNLAGIHGAGAALHARREWGAQLGVGVGFTGNAYALPTKRNPYVTLSLEEIRMHVESFLPEAAARPKDRFLLSRVGCGREGYSEGEIAPMFRGATSNVLLVDDDGNVIGLASAWWKKTLSQTPLHSSVAV